MRTSIWERYLLLFFFILEGKRYHFQISSWRNQLNVHIEQRKRLKDSLSLSVNAHLTVKAKEMLPDCKYTNVSVCAKHQLEQEQHSCRMLTARLVTVSGGGGCSGGELWKANCMLGYTQPRAQTHLQKHYLSATTVAGGKNNTLWHRSFSLLWRTWKEFYDNFLYYFRREKEWHTEVGYWFS